ncbi:RND superfamily putative drug exporter [Crossiella equi]|uniref:RND superfamily putative drug exporter n=1 Tax=Crossiella equi TaxID=130796 RepID=A0ABS5AH62_9PSEU|nr:MMPL family transporter [Crossiella equi]MBP2475554.1 RND superfamily putative drug exporter [Crossiella equi]
MFVSWGSVVHRRRWVVLVAALLLTVLGGAWGSGVFDKLTQGGYEDPNSQAITAVKTMDAALGRQSGDVVVIYEAPAGGTIDDPALGQKINAKLAELPSSEVSKVVSYWMIPDPQMRAAFADKEHKKGLAVITMTAGDDSNKAIQSYEKIKDKFAVDGVTSQVGGLAPTGAEINDISQRDLLSAELVALPITLILLVLIFGGLVAASLPVLVGGLSILGALGVLNVLTNFVDVNTFAVNVASLLGLGMAIDYGLFMVGRFREELAAGREPNEAVRRTVATAGRTVAFSATLLVIALAGLLLFPQGFLRSVSYGGMASVAVAALVSLTLLPALLAVLGRRVDKLGLPWRKGKTKTADEEGKGWRKLALAVMKRPVVVSVPIIAVLVLLGSPFLGASFGEVTEKVLPEGNQIRVTTETLNKDFPSVSKDAAQIVLQGKDGQAPSQAAVQQFIGDVGKVDGVTNVQPSGAAKDVVGLTAKLPGDVLGQDAKDAVKKIRALTPPDGTQVLVGGISARVSDSLDAIADGLPWMILVIVGATLVLMFLAFGSVLLPVKAVVMSALSLSATFGVLTWVFQDGHGASLLGVSPGPLEAGIVVLMAALVFGLSTDYEVFLMSRMVEARAKGASSEEAVATGLVRTGRVISSAAILLIMVTGAFAFADIAIMRFVGVGMILALALDATVVRMLLVPAVLKLLGNAAWWAPGPLRRLQQRVGIHEGEDVEEDAPKSREPQPVG